MENRMYLHVPFWEIDRVMAIFTRSAKSMIEEPGAPGEIRTLGLLLQRHKSVSSYSCSSNQIKHLPPRRYSLKLVTCCRQHRGYDVANFRLVVHNERIAPANRRLNLSI